jgi:hypothetical protein
MKKGYPERIGIALFHFNGDPFDKVESGNVCYYHADYQV